MKIAICAPFMKSDIWQERLQRATPGYSLEFDEFYHPEDVRGAVHFHYNACVVVMSGAVGLESVVAARERDTGLPILWISDDEHFGLAAYDLQVTMFLKLGCSDKELADAMLRFGGQQKGENS